MSFERKLNYKKKNYKRYKSYSKGRVMPLVQRKAINSMITKRIQSVPEKKFFDVSFNTQGISTSGLQYPVTFVTQGDGVNNRIGEKIHITSLYYRCIFDVADSTNLVRFCVIQILDDDTSFGTTPIYSTFFKDSTGGDPTNQKELLSPLRITNRLTKFKVLLDKHIDLNNYDKNRMIVEGKLTNFVKDLTFFTSGYGHNNIYFCAWSDSLALAHPTWSFQSRIRYTDI